MSANVRQQKCAIFMHIFDLCTKRAGWCIRNDKKFLKHCKKKLCLIKAETFTCQKKGECEEPWKKGDQKLILPFQGFCFTRWRDINVMIAAADGNNTKYM